MSLTEDEMIRNFIEEIDRLYVDCTKAVLPLVAQQLLKDGSPKFDMYEIQAQRIANLTHLIAKFCVQNHHAFRLEEDM